MYLVALILGLFTDWLRGWHFGFLLGFGQAWTLLVGRYSRDLGNVCWVFRVWV